jgi:hypothetical protein
MKTVAQIFAIARMEFRFGWRRSAPVVMTVLIGLIVGTGIMLMQISALRDMTPTLNEMPPDKVARLTALGFTLSQYQQLVTEFLGDMTSTSGATLGWVLMSMAVLFLPVATVSTIPADRKFDVMEVLRSTPITGSVYLAGKMLGVLAIVLFAGLIPFLVFLAVMEGVLLNFLHIGISFSTLKFYIELSLLDGLPLLACGSIIGVLTGVVFRTRRTAIFPGFLAGLISLFLWLTTFKPPSSSFPMTDVAEYYVFLNFHSQAESTLFKLIGIEGYGLLGPQPAIVEIGQLIIMYMVILLTLFTTALLARLWLQWKENF